MRRRSSREREGKIFPMVGGGGERPEEIARIGPEIPFHDITKWAAEKTGLKFPRGIRTQGKDGDPGRIPCNQMSPNGYPICP